MRLLIVALSLVMAASPAAAQVACTVTGEILTCPPQEIRVPVQGYTAPLPAPTTTTIIQSVPGAGGIPSPPRALYAGRTQYHQVGTFAFDWTQVPSGIDSVVAHLHGAGSSGGGSPWVQFGGGGGSGGYMECIVPRPASGVTLVRVGAGGTPVPTGTWANGNPGGETSFGSECIAYGSPLGGQHAYGPSTGGDGGSGGYGRGADTWLSIPGGQGDASPPQMNGVNITFPRGANAPMGGTGGNNWQMGLTPGGGGAPGNSQFPSGAGGDGWVEVYW